MGLIVHKEVFVNLPKKISNAPVDGLVKPPNQKTMNYEDSEPGFQHYLRQIAQYPLLTPDQEISLAAKIRKGDRKAKEQMIRANLRLS